MSESVRVACQGSMLVDLDELNHFQGNLKDLTEENFRKLRKEILELGFSSPFHVWRAGDGKLYLLDGHQRLRTLTQMRKDGIQVPELPAVEVEASDVKEAKRKVLALTSQYGQMTRDGLWEFMNQAELNMAEVANSFRFPEIDLAAFAIEHGSANPGGDATNATDGEPTPGEIEFSKEIDEKNDYLVLLFRTRADFSKACEKLGVGQVTINPSASLHEKFRMTGQGRIVDGAAFIAAGSK